MNTLDALFSRKSIRTYNGENISEEQLRIILKAANSSPVGRALFETLHITVISNKEYLSKWEDYCEEMTAHRQIGRAHV